MNSVLSLNEFFVEGGDQHISHVLLHITEPSTADEKEAGHFFALCEVNNAEADYLTKLQTLINTIEAAYYQPVPNQGVRLLEKILEKINPETTSFIQEDVTINFVVGVLKHNEITLSFYGAPLLTLFYRNKEGLYHSMDLLKNNEETTPSATAPQQLFSQLVQGKINPSDYVLIATPHLVDYFDTDRLQKIITTRPTRQSAEHFERILREVKNNQSFGGLILQLNKKEEAPPLPPRKPRVGLPNTRPTTVPFFDGEKKSNNSFWPELRDKLTNIFAQKISPLLSLPTPTPRTTNEKQDTASQQNVSLFFQTFLRFLLKVAHGLGKTIAFIGLCIWLVLKSIFTLIVTLFFIVTNFQNRRKSILEQWSIEWRSYKENYRALPLYTKLLLLFAFTVFIIFIGSLIYVHLHQKQLQARVAFEQTLEQLSVQKNKAESALIYHDDATALKELLAGEAILKTLSCTTPTDKTRCSDLQKQFTDLIEKTQRLSSSHPQELTTWEISNPNEAPTHLVKIGPTLIGFGQNTSTLFIYNTLTHEKKTLHPNLITNGFLSGAVPKENDYLAIFNSRNELFLFNPKDETLKKVDLSFPKDGVRIADIAIYNRRLYVLDSAHQQIYRHDAIKSGFGLGKEWLKDTTLNFGENTTFTLDGDVYIFLPNGDIKKFSSGLNTPFTLQPLSPPLQHGGRIWTYTDLKNIFLLESANQRMLVIDKDGHLVNQFSFKEAGAVSDMVVDDSQKHAYLLAQNKLLQLSY